MWKLYIFKDKKWLSKTHQELQILYNIHTHKTLHFSHNKKEGEYTIINEIALKYD